MIGHDCLCEQVLKVKKFWVCLFRGKILWREGMGGVVYGGIILQTGGRASTKNYLFCYILGFLPV
jgi:hypothetical protein